MYDRSAGLARLFVFALLATIGSGAAAAAQSPRGGVFESNPKIDNVGVRCHYAGATRNRVRVDLGVRHSDVRREGKYSRYFLKVQGKVRLERLDGSKLAAIKTGGRLRTGVRGRLIRHRFHHYLSSKASRRVLNYIGTGKACERNLGAKRQLTVKARISQTLRRPGAAASIAALGGQSKGAFRSLQRTVVAANPPLFRAPIATATGGTDSRGVEIGRFTRLPIADVAVPSQDSRTLSVLLGTGAGGFAAAPGSPIDLGKLPGGTENVPDAVVSGQLNSGSRTDLAVSIEFGRVAVLLGSGDGSFSAAPGPMTKVSPEPRYMAIGDLNSDGEQDLAIVHPVPKDELPNNMTVLLGDGRGGFAQAPGSPFPGGGRPADVAIGQFTAEPKNDLAVADFESPGASLLLGTGLGEFAAGPGSPFGAGAGPASIATGDLNGDGDNDVAMSDRLANNVTIFYGDGAGGLTLAAQPFPVGTAPLAVTIADLDGDGRKDIVTANINSNDVSVLLNGGGGNFSQAPGSPYQAGAKPVDLDVGDLNGDGRPDLGVADDAAGVVSVLLNNG